MHSKYDLNLYLNQLSCVTKILRNESAASAPPTTPRLDSSLTMLDNYLNQVKCISKSTKLFEEDELLMHARPKLLFKINKLISEKTEEINAIL
jgi:hypothetical protein